MNKKISNNRSVKKSVNSTKKKSTSKKNIKPVKLHWVKQQSLIARRRNKRDFDFVVDWQRVEVDDRTLLQIEKKMRLEPDDAFDRSLDILENNEHFRHDAKWIYREYMKKRFRGNWIHLAWFSFENIQLGIEDNKWNRIAYATDRVYLSDAVKQSVYDAEDGRCERCGQAMHFRVAYFAKRDWTVFGSTDNLQLLCYACSKNRKNMLLNPELIILDRNMEYLRLKLDLATIEEAKAYVQKYISYAVHMNTFNPNKQSNKRQVKMKIRGQYWLPGVGKCRLQVRTNNDGAREYTLEFTECAQNPKITIQKQKHSRKLTK